MRDRNAFVVTLDRHFQQTSYGVQNSGIKRKSYISQALDSLEEDTIWHRCKLECTIPSETNLYVAYYASNSKSILYQGVELVLDEILHPSSKYAEKQDAIFAPLWQEIIADGTDFPIHKAKGRYLWLKIEYVTYGREEPVIRDAKIDFPLRPLTWMLPEIYQQDEASADLLNRFLGIFQSLMDDLDDNIKDISFYLDVDQVDTDFLHWLCRWLDVQEYFLWPEDKLRQFLKSANDLYKIKGTRKSIERVTEICTGQKPLIVEYHEIEQFLQNDRTKLHTRLYGDNIYTFTVMVQEEFVPSNRHYLELKRIIESFTPAHTICKLVVLRPYLFLDSYSYLGINTVLSGSGNLVLDGKASISFESTIGEWRIE